MKSHIKRIDVSTSGPITHEAKKQIDSRFKEETSPLREERIKNVRKALDIGTTWDREGVQYVVKEHRDFKDPQGNIIIHQDDWSQVETKTAQVKMNHYCFDTKNHDREILDFDAENDEVAIEKAKSKVEEEGDFVTNVWRYLPEGGWVKIAQVQPISAITPRQPLNDNNRVVNPLEKRKSAPPEGDFHKQLQDSLLEVDSTMFKQSLPLTEASMDKEAYVVKQGDEYCVKSEKGKNLGCGPSQEWAENRLKQVHYFKNKEK